MPVYEKDLYMGENRKMWNMTKGKIVIKKTTIIKQNSGNLH